MQLSVIIPTRDRLPTLQRTLAALAEQRLDGVNAEVIVVDNGSADGTLAMLESLADGYPLPLRPLAESSPGAGPARNAGLTAARGDIVLFLGDDTRPARPDLLRHHAELHATATADPYAVLGRVGWAPELEVTPLMRWLEHGAQFAYADMHPGPAGPEHFYTAHVSSSRALVQAAGGFDERVPFLFEDSLLGWRLFEAGLTLDYHPELLVHHEHAITLAGWVRRQEQVGQAGRRLRERHDVEERLVPRPGGWRWTAAAAIARVAGSPASEWQRWPAPVRDRLYAAAHYAAYARGYRAATSGSAARRGPG
jgi:glycosyltransferase involved in cell wall biosynthesis